jgi:hypothetical protein
MNDTEYNNLIFLAENYKHICINMSEYAGIITGHFWNLMGVDLITEQKIIQTGLYATLFSAKLWVGKHIAPSYVSVSNNGTITSIEKIWLNEKELSKWSDQCPLKLANEMERALKLKAFW